METELWEHSWNWTCHLQDAKKCRPYLGGQEIKDLLCLKKTTSLDER